MAYTHKSKPYQKDPNYRSAEDRALDRFAELLIHQLETGKKENWQKPWNYGSGGRIGLPQSIGGRKYEGMNSMLLQFITAEQGWKSPIFATAPKIDTFNGERDADGKFHPALDGNGEKLPIVHILKGEKALPVSLSWWDIAKKPTFKEKITFEEYNHLTKEEQKDYSIKRMSSWINVFNIDQTNLNEARPEIYNKLVAKFAPVEKEETAQDEQQSFSLKSFDEMVKENLWICPIKPLKGDQAYFRPSQNIIIVPEKEQFINGESFYSTSFHEMAHSTGTETWLNRDLKNFFGSPAYAKEELVAEITAASVATNYGFEQKIKDESKNYVDGWLDSLKKDPSFIKDIIKDVDAASKMIIKRMDNIDRIMNEAEKTGLTPDYSAIREDIKAHTAKSDNVATLRLKDLGTYDVPEWSLNYIENGDAEGLTDKEVEIVDKFMNEHFPEGEVHEIDFDNPNELNFHPSFGTRNEDALTGRGESPYEGVKTYPVHFFHPSKRELVMTREDLIAASVSQLDNNILKSRSGDVKHFGYDKSQDLLYAGALTNSGIQREILVKYNHGNTLEENIENLQDRLLMKEARENPLDNEQQEQQTRGRGR